jgi:AcrR family transcriptional regulator
VAADALRITDGESHCRIPDPTSGTVNAPLLEIGLQGALVDTKIQLEANAYIDVTLALKDIAPRQLFAHVVTSGNEGLRLRWLHFDPGEEGKLKSLLEAYARARAGAHSSTSHSGTRRVVRPKGDAPPATSEMPAVPASSTRRLVRPSASAITPFSDLGPPAPAAESSSSARVGTRRVVRPSQQALTPFADAVSEPTPVIGEDSRTQHVVIEPTDRFEKLIDVGEEKARSAPKPTPPAKPAATTTTPAVEQIATTPSGGNPVVGSANAAAANQAANDASGAQRVQEARGENSGAHQVTGGKTAVVGKDGRMDIGASIRSHAKTIRASELASRHERVRVLNMATIKSLIQEAVEEAAGHLTRSLGEAERKRLLEEAEEGFQERLKSFQAEKQSAEERNKRLNEQLESARRLLEDERKRTIKADQFTVSDEGLGEIEDRFKRLLDRTLATGGVPADVEEELRALISRILDSEREKIREKELEAQNAKIELLERKISRLAGSLEESEKQRDDAQKFAAFLESQGGGALRNVYEAGIKGEDPNKEKKLALMKKILDENRALRNSLGIELKEVKDEPKKEEPKKAEVQAPASVKDVPTADVVPDPEPVAEASPVDDTTDAEGSSEPTVNPDDEVWEVKPLANLTEGTNESGIKRIDVTSVLGKGPPPRQSR